MRIAAARSDCLPALRAGAGQGLHPGGSITRRRNLRTGLVARARLRTIRAVPAERFAYARLAPLVFLLVLFVPPDRTFAESSPDLRRPRAQKLFQQHCAPCHGADGRARTPIARQLKVRDLSTSEAADETVAAAIREGLRNARGVVVMPPFADKLSVDEVEMLVEHVRTLRVPPKP